MTDHEQAARQTAVEYATRIALQRAAQTCVKPLASEVVDDAEKIRAFLMGEPRNDGSRQAGD